MPETWWNQTRGIEGAEVVETEPELESGPVGVELESPDPEAGTGNRLGNSSIDTGPP